MQVRRFDFFEEQAILVPDRGIFVPPQKRVRRVEADGAGVRVKSFLKDPGQCSYVRTFPFSTDRSFFFAPYAFHD